MIYLYLVFGITILSGVLMFIVPKKALVALSLAGLYTIFLKPYGLEKFLLLGTFAIFFFVLYLGISLFGLREEIEEES